MRRRDTNCHLILIEWPAAPPPAIPAATGQTRHPRQHWPWLRPDGTHRPLTRTRCRTYVHACMHTYTHARVPSSMPRHNRPSPELPGRLSRYTTSTVSNPRDTLPPRHTACTARRARVAPQHVAPAAHGPDYAWPPRHMAPKATAEGSEQQVGEVSKAPTHAASTGHTLCPTVRADPHRGELHPLASQILAEDSCIHRPRRSAQRIAASTVRADPRRGELHAPYSQILADPRRGELHPPSPQILASGGWPIAHTYTSDLRAPVRESPHLGALFHVRGHVFHTGPVRAPGRQTAPPFHRITIGRAAGRLITPMMPGKQQIKCLCSRYWAYGPPR